jgi:hypothetical protein
MKNRSLLPDPPMLFSESADDFKALRECLEQEIEPCGFIERMYVTDISAITWDILRLRRCKAAIINMAVRPAVRDLLRPLLSEPDDLADRAGQKADSLSLGWFTDPQAKNEVSELLAAVQLDESAIEAEALRQSSPILERIDRMLASAEARRNKLLRSIGEYRASLARQLRESSDRIIDGKGVLRLEHSSDESSAA